MNSLVKEYMARNKVVVAYVRDVYGFRTGIVVALSKNQLGYSMVNKSADVEWKRMKPYQLPTIQRMIHLDYSIVDIVESSAYRKCVQNDHTVRVPCFDRKLGLMYAIDSALNKEIQYNDETKEFITAKKVVGFNQEMKTPIFKSAVNSDPELWKVIKTVAERAGKVKW